MLAHAGLSTSSSTNTKMVSSLSTKSGDTITKCVQAICASLGYDNLDIAFKSEQPTIEGPGSKLIHMTTGTFFPLNHGVVKEDLRCVKELWDSSPSNPNRAPENIPSYESIPTYARLTDLAAKSGVPEGDPKSHHKLMAWHIRQILITHAGTPKEGAHDLRAQAETILSIPVAKTTQIPARALNVNVGENSGNGAAINDFIKQGGMSNKDMDEYVLLTHGDLGTGEKIAALQKSRRIEPGLGPVRLAQIVFIPGFFHIKMACADALWKAYIEATKPSASGSPHRHSIFEFCAILRPKQTRKLASKPGFRLQHNLINHVLTASILQCWTIEVEARFGVKDLEEWMATSPSVADIMAISETIAKKYVAPPVYRDTKDQDGDAVSEIMRLWNRDALLYVATSHAANTGDIGRVEQLLLLWINLWKGVGKHKYASHISDFLLNLDQKWNPRLARAIRLNWLVNPMGKPSGFRGADWVVERNNLRHKRTYSGQGPNRTVDFIIKQSPLIEIYQNTHRLIECDFHLSGRTLKHPPPMMKKTLEKLRAYMDSEKILTVQKGRKMGKLKVVDYRLKGMASLLVGSSVCADDNPVVGDEVLETIDESVNAGDIGVDE